MATGLLDASPAFAALMGECEAALAPHVEWSLEEVLREEQGLWLERLDIVQPALFAVMVSLAGLWRRCGVEPAAVIGHSQGEIAAAHIAGALSLEDAALIIAKRGEAMAKIAGQGAMLSVSLEAEQLPPHRPLRQSASPSPRSTAPPPLSSPGTPRPSKSSESALRPRARGQSRSRSTTPPTRPRSRR